MREPHTKIRHGVSLLTGERFTVIETIEAPIDRGKILRRMVWPTSTTAYPASEVRA